MLSVVFLGDLETARMELTDQLISPARRRSRPSFTNEPLSQRPSVVLGAEPRPTAGTLFLSKSRRLFRFVVSPGNAVLQTTWKERE